VRFRRQYPSPPPTFRRRGRFFDYMLTGIILGLLTLVVVRVQEVETVNRAGIANVLDGDSLELGGERIRLEGIDAPEFDQTCKSEGKTIPCGQEARRRLRQLTGSDRLSCKGWQRDKYDRLLARMLRRSAKPGARSVASGRASSSGRRTSGG
jgi:endonuclease YncB( thermonuclease family)